MGVAGRHAGRDRPGTLMDIRPYRDEDEQAVIALWETCGLTRPWNPPAGDIALPRSSGHGEILLAEEDGAVIGSVMVGHDGHRGWVYYLAADPAQRRAGIGRALMRAAEDWLKARGVRKLELMVRGRNSAGLGFYRRNGLRTPPRLRVRPP